MSYDLIISRGKTYNYDNEKLFEFFVNRKGEECSREYHSFVYSPSRKQFANRISFYATGRKLYNNPSKNIWHSSVVDMMERYRKWVTHEDEFSRDMILLSSHDPNLQKQLRPVLDDNYIASVVKLWENLDQKFKNFK